MFPAPRPVAFMNLMKSCIVSWYGNFLGTIIVASCLAWQSGVIPTAYSSQGQGLTPVHFSAQLEPCRT